MLYMPREEGQGLVEYALILVLVAVVVIVILALLGPAIVTSSRTSFAHCSLQQQCFHRRGRPTGSSFCFPIHQVLRRAYSGNFMNFVATFCSSGKACVAIS